MGFSQGTIDAIDLYLAARFVASQILPNEQEITPFRDQRVKGIEPSSVAWKATALPLSYTRAPNKLTRLVAAAKFFLARGASSFILPFPGRRSS
jgi:hypothetical protein